VYINEVKQRAHTFNWSQNSC